MEALTNISVRGVRQKSTGGPNQWELIREIMGSSIRDEVTPYPYDSQIFEHFSLPIEDRRQRLVNSLLRLQDSQGIGAELWCMSGNLSEITETVGTHQALDRVYLGPNEQLEPENTSDIGLKWAHYCLSHLLNARGARNRLRIVEEEFRNSVSGFNGGDNAEFNVLSVAAGSSRGLMTVMHNLAVMRHIGGAGAENIFLTMVDQSEKAEEDAKALSSSLEINGRVRFIKENVFKFRKYLDDKKFDFIEVVGLLDYLKDRHVVRLLENLWEHLADGGVLLYSNIAPNSERRFTEEVVGWPEMEYRIREQLTALGVAAGIPIEQLRHIKDPLGIYNLIAAMKRSRI